MDKRTKELRSDAKHLSPILQVGKSGVTQGVIDQIDRELRTRRLIKIKLLKSALSEEPDKKERHGVAEDIALRTNSRIIEQVGNIVVLHRT